jgi:iron complex outermembrane receptor protein
MYLNHKNHCATLCLCIVAVLIGTRLSAADVTALSLEELMQIEVTTVAKKSQPMSQVPAAVFVITREDIRRSTASTVPELLQVVPGIHSGMITSSASAVSSRGQSGRFANKLLVMIDGRSIYTPLFSGVLWELHNLVLEDVERIEVIRGPGGTLWGSNAVNGVINILTRHAHDTQGAYVSSRIGTDRTILEGRYGMQLSDSAWLRIYGQGSEYDAGFAEVETHDDWRDSRMGFRLDWEPSPDDTVTLQGDVYNNRIGRSEMVPSTAPATFPAYELINDSDYDGGNLLFRWTRQLEDDADFSLQMYWDSARFDAPKSIYQRDTFDVDFQHRFQLTEKHEIVWGVGYRGTYDEVDPGLTVTAGDKNTHFEIGSAFVQDQIELIEDTLSLTVGTKVEYNDYTREEFQPSARLVWNQNERSMMWAAYSRAVRTPSRSEDDLRIVITAEQLNPDPPPEVYGLVTLAGDDELGSEELDSYEIGWRFGLENALLLDLTAYYNDYDELVIYAPVGLDAVPNNGMSGESYGFEAAVTWQLNDDWRLHGTYAYSTLFTHLDSGVGVDRAAETNEEDAFPANQATLGASWDITDSVQFDVLLRYSDNLAVVNVEQFIEMDIRLGWHVNDNLQVSLNGRNLLDGHHAEFGSDNVSGTAVTEARRSFMLELIYRF